MTGATCRNGHALLDIRYDANGWKTWCPTCGVPLNHEPTRELRFGEVLLLSGLLALALTGAGAWFWWTWLA